MKVLVTGVKGQLGFDVVNELEKRGHTAIGVDVDTMDITNSEQVENVIKANMPEAVIHCAAYTAVDLAEDNKELCDKINGEGTENIAKVCKEINAKLMYISTDYVFNGEGERPWQPDDTVTIPLNEYGYSKYLGEQAVQKYVKDFYIVRIAWVFGINGKNFVKTMVNLAKTHDTLNVVNDQLGNPTNAVDLAYHILKLAVSHDYGIYHCTGSGICSWYDFASEIIRLSGLPCTVKPVTSAQYKEMNPKSADRPAWSALENRALRCSVGDDMRDWKDAIQDFFNNWDGK